MFLPSVTVVSKLTESLMVVLLNGIKTEVVGLVSSANDTDRAKLLMVLVVFLVLGVT